MIWVLTGLVFLSVMVFMATVIVRPNDPVQSRLKQIGYTEKGKVISQQEAELATAFKERVVKPAVEKMAQLSGRYLPSGIIKNLKFKLIQAGNPMPLNSFLAFQFVSALVFPGAFFGLLLLAKLPSVQLFFFSGFVFVIGLLYPQKFWLSSKIGARKKAIQRGLPDVLDLLTVCVEAGLGFDSALNKVVEKVKGPIADEFNHCMQEVRMNKPRNDALHDMADRAGVEDLMNFVASLIQSDKLGTSIAKTLRIQSEEMRVKRRQKAEEMAQQAAIKMLFPLIMCIFPSMFIVLLGPVVISVAGGGMSAK